MKEENKQSLSDWMQSRVPFWNVLPHLKNYRTPINLNFTYQFGFILGVILMLQIATGLFLAMHYTPHVDHAFDSVENIMRNVNYGWLLRYLHATGASMFFAVMYLHMGRGLYYGSYKSPREVIWIIGLVLFFAVMATGFMGYVLPWGQMSFWGATVITNLFTAIPYFGESIAHFLWGGYSIDNPTLNRFFVLHYLLPFIILALTIFHVAALHMKGSSNPTGIEIKDVAKETVPFHPYYTIKDALFTSMFFLVYFFLVFFMPNILGDPVNYVEANPMVTPPHIVPEWYFLPFYAILRAIPSKIGGVIAMFGAIIVLFIVPWLDRSKIRSGKFRPLFSIFFTVFVFNFLLLGYLGNNAKQTEGWMLILSRISVFYYYAYFFVILPWLSIKENNSNIQLPESVHSYLTVKR